MWIYFQFHLWTVPNNISFSFFRNTVSRNSSNNNNNNCRNSSWLYNVAKKSFPFTSKIESTHQIKLNAKTKSECSKLNDPWWMTYLFPCRNFDVPNNRVFGGHPIGDPNFFIAFYRFPIFEREIKTTFFWLLLF